MKDSLRTCAHGHQYYKSSDCPTCPVCEQERKPASGFLSLISAPARRALLRLRVSTLAQLAQYSEGEIAALHGMGPKAIKILQHALAGEGRSFKQLP